MNQADESVRFLDELIRALRQRGKPLTDARTIAKQVHQPLWNAVEMVREESARTRAWPVPNAFTTATQRERDRVDRAKALEQATTRLLRRLPAPNLVNLFEYGLDIREAQRTLERLRDAAARVAARPRAPGRPGRPRNDTRWVVNQWVALVLREHGRVRPTKAKTGIFARVLLVVHEYAGFKPSTIERDVRDALNAIAARSQSTQAQAR